MPFKSVLLAASLVASVSAGVAAASPVTFFFSQEITEILGDSLGRYAAAGVEVGTRFTGSVTYDSTTTNQQFGSTNFDAWDFTSIAISGPLGPISATPEEIRAISFSESDVWTAQAQNDAGNFRHELRVEGDFGYNIGSPIDVGAGLDRQIIGPPAFGQAFENSVLSYFDPNASVVGLSQVAIGRTTFFETAPEPEVIPLPATLPMLLGGLLAAAAVIRRAREKAA